MTAAEIIAEATARGFQVSLSHASDGLILWPGDDPPADLVDLVRSAKPQILAVLRAERGRINYWIAKQIIDWPPTSCLHCRKPIIVGQKWLELVNDNSRARFHSDCVLAWRAEQEAAARRALGLPTTSTEETTP